MRAQDAVKRSDANGCTVRGPSICDHGLQMPTWRLEATQFRRSKWQVQRAPWPTAHGHGSSFATVAAGAPDAWISPSRIHTPLLTPTVEGMADPGPRAAALEPDAATMTGHLVARRCLRGGAGSAAPATRHDR